MSNTIDFKTPRVITQFNSEGMCYRVVAAEGGRMLIDAYGVDSMGEEAWINQGDVDDTIRTMVLVMERVSDSHFTSALRNDQRTQKLARLIKRCQQAESLGQVKDLIASHNQDPQES